MATIKFRRGSGQPTGLTAYEPAWDTTNNRLFVNNGSTAVWVGAPIDNDSTLSGNCAWTVPTQFSVKTYVDSQVAGGAVSSVNGATGAITIAGGTGISVLTVGRGITLFNAGVLSINGNTGVISNVAFTNVAQTFTQLQTFSAGISASSGAVITGLATLFNDLDLKGGLTVGGSARFTSATSFNSGVSFTNGPLSINGTIRNDSGTGITFNTAIKVSDDSTFLKNLDVNGAFRVTGGGTFGSLYVVGPAAIDGSVSLLGGFDAKGATFGNLVRFSAGICASGGVTLSGSFRVGGTASFGGNAGFGGNVDVGAQLTANNGTFAKRLSIESEGISFAGGIYGSGGATFDNTRTQNLSVTNKATIVDLEVTNGATFSDLYIGSSLTVDGQTTLRNVTTNNLTVAGDLTVNGTTTTVNSTTVTVQDPIIAIGGLTGNIPPVAGDVKDRGVVFQWGDGTSGRTGFFGLDRSTGRFTFLPIGVSVSGEVVTGTAGNAELAGVYAPQGLLTLAGVSGSANATATITLNGGTGTTTRSINHSAYRHVFNNGADAANPPAISLIGSAGVASTNIFSGADLTDKVFTLPNMTGTAVVADAMGATSGWVLRGTGALTTPTWINPAASGFTAFGAERSVLQLITPVKNSSSYPVLFGGSTTGYQSVHADSLNDINWNPGTVTLTIGSGNGKLEGVVDGGAF